MIWMGNFCGRLQIRLSSKAACYEELLMACYSECLLGPGIENSAVH